MKTLILCVDRDDDLGVKAALTSPIIGRKDNLRAAISLGLKDPEDSDTNSIFAALKIYDEYYEENKDAEIATLCGHKNVGKKSDSIITFQLETVLQSIKPDSVVVVTDGAEDEFILPLIWSQIKIDSVVRVIIRQQKNIEGTLYFIGKALQDEKISRNILIPLAIVLVIWGIFSLFGRFNEAIGATLIVLGIYILVKVKHLEEPVKRLATDIKASLQTGKYILVSASLIAMGIFIIGLYDGYIHAISDSSPAFPTNLLVFMEQSIFYFIGAAFIFILGRTLDIYLRTDVVMRSSLSIMISVFAILFFFLAINHILQYFFNVIDEFNLTDVIIYIALGFSIGFISIETYRYIKDHYPETHAQEQAQ